VEAKFKNGKLIIEVELETPRTSGSGGSKLFAQGSVKIPITTESGAHEILHGKPATIQVNAYVPIKHFA